MNKGWLPRSMTRRALRCARAKDGASHADVSPTFGAQLVAMGLLREVVVRVAITGAILERRWKLTERGEFWLDDDSATPLVPPPMEDEPR